MKSKSISKVLLLFGMMYLALNLNNVDANTINNIDMDIYIDKNGNAEVTEVWNANLTKGTEGYRSYTNLGYSSISQFKVEDGEGREYKVLSSWDVNGSFSDKAYKCGIHSISNGRELCWGISKYGDNTYVLSYKISNFVNKYTDKQGIYFNLLNLDQYVGKAKIKIHSDIDFSLENARIWGFGNKGTTTFENGSIIMDSKGSLSSSDYMVILVRFEEDIFDVSRKLSSSFDDVYKSAMNGVDKNEYINDSKEDNSDMYDEVSPFRIISIIFSVIVMILFSPYTIILIIIIVIKKKGINLSHLSGTVGDLDFGIDGKKLPKESEINYYRDIPCQKDLDRAYWVLYYYDIIPVKTLNSGIIGAILLKWIKEQKITVTKTRKGLFNFKDNNYAISFNDLASYDNKTESKLFSMLKEAAGSNGILEAKEFEKWCKKKYNKVDGWFTGIRSRAKSKLEEEGLIVNDKKEVNGIFRKRVVNVQKVSESLKEEAINLIGFKKFLLDFSLMPEKEFMQVHLWDEYLIFAQLLGIADKVEEQFSKLYPEFNNQSLLNTEFTTVAIRSMANIGYSAVVIGRNRAASYSGSSSSSGGGGSSFSSGGHSSGGSSGGGFR